MSTCGQLIVTYMCMHMHMCMHMYMCMCTCETFLCLSLLFLF